MSGQEGFGGAGGWKKRLPNQLFGRLEEFLSKTVVSERALATFGVEHKQGKTVDLAADSLHLVVAVLRPISALVWGDVALSSQ
jgi:hypothetical protein